MNPFNHLIGSIMNNFGKDCYRQITDLVENAVLYRQVLDVLDIEVPVLRKYFKNISFAMTLTDCSSYEICGQQTKNMNQDGIRNQYDFTWFKKTPILFLIKSSHANMEISAMTVHNKKYIKNLKAFCQKLLNDCQKYRESRSGLTCFTFNGSYFIKVNNKVHRRCFENVFISKTVKNKLMSNLNNFLTNKKWYESHHLAYHYGILLQGPPGTGKTSIIQTIASMSNLPLYILDNYHIEDGLRKLVNETMENPMSPKIIVVEDIDSVLFTKNRNIELDPSGTRDQHALFLESKGLSGLLNQMDGLCVIQNVIYIFTTNHIEQLDPALIRPGRIDLILEIGYVTDETFSQFIKHHFNKEIPQGFHIKDGVTFAELQNKVLEKIKFEELLNQYRKEDN